jgi:hypothetical protein
MARRRSLPRRIVDSARPRTGQLVPRRTAPVEIQPQEEELPMEMEPMEDPPLVRSDGTEGGDTATHLRGLLRRYSTHASPEYLVRRTDHEGRVEYRATVYVYRRTRLISTHMGPARRDSSAEAVADAAFEALTHYTDLLGHQLGYTTYEYFSRRRMGTSRFYGPRARHYVSMSSVGYSMNMLVDTSRRLATALDELQILRDRLWMAERRDVPSTSSERTLTAPLPLPYSEGSSPAAPPQGPSDGASHT